MLGRLLAWPARCCVWVARTLCNGCIEAAQSVGRGMVKSGHRASNAALDVAGEGVRAAQEIAGRLRGGRKGDG